MNERTVTVIAADGWLLDTTSRRLMALRAALSAFGHDAMADTLAERDVTGRTFSELARRALRFAPAASDDTLLDLLAVDAERRYRAEASPPAFAAPEVRAEIESLADDGGLLLRWDHDDVAPPVWWPLVEESLGVIFGRMPRALAGDGLHVARQYRAVREHIREEIRSRRSGAQIRVREATPHARRLARCLAGGTHRAPPV